MTIEEPQRRGTDISLEVRTEMDELGITLVPVDYFHCGKYRYTNVKDAIAEAKRRAVKP